jgi:hypothetical protein
MVVDDLNIDVFTEAFGWQIPYCWECGKLMTVQAVSHRFSWSVLFGRVEFYCWNKEHHRAGRINALIFERPRWGEEDQLTMRVEYPAATYCYDF